MNLSFAMLTANLTFASGKRDIVSLLPFSGEGARPWRAVEGLYGEKLSNEKHQNEPITGSSTRPYHRPRASRNRDFFISNRFFRKMRNTCHQLTIGDDGCRQISRRISEMVANGSWRTICTTRAPTSSGVMGMASIREDVNSEKG